MDMTNELIAQMKDAATRLEDGLAGSVLYPPQGATPESNNLKFGERAKRVFVDGMCRGGILASAALLASRGFSEIKQASSRNPDIEVGSLSQGGYGVCCIVGSIAVAPVGLVATTACAPGYLVYKGMSNALKKKGNNTRNV